MARIATVRCSVGHPMRWQASHNRYVHVHRVMCDRIPDPTGTTWQ